MLLASAAGVAAFSHIQPALAQIVTDLTQNVGAAGSLTVPAPATSNGFQTTSTQNGNSLFPAVSITVKLKGPRLAGASRRSRVTPGASSTSASWAWSMRWARSRK